MRLIRTLFFLIVLVGVDMFFTRRALQGSWQLEMTPQVEANIKTLLDHNAGDDGSAPGVGAAVRRWLRQGASAVGAALVKGAAAQVKVEVEGDHFRITQPSGEAVAATMIALATHQDSAQTGCASGTIVPVFPLVRVTCAVEGEDRVGWVLMRGWPGERAAFFPLGLSEERMKEIAATIQEGAGGEPAAVRDPHVRAAVEDLFTARFKKLPPTP